MTTTALANPTIAPPVRAAAPRRTSFGRALRTLARRRAALTAHNPRQIAVPMLTPILFALVIAPALNSALGGLASGIDYTAFVAVGTVGLLVPLATTFAGLSVLVDRNSGARARSKSRASSRSTDSHRASCVAASRSRLSSQRNVGRT